MICRNLVVMFVLSISLFGVDKTEDFVEYSQLSINSNLSVYAAEVNMKHVRDDMYSIGLLIHNEKKSGTDFGVGYVQPSNEIGLFSGNELASNDTGGDSKMIFFMNCSF